MHYIYIKQFNNISLMTFMSYLKYWCVCIDSLIVILLANQIILEPTLLVYSVTVQLLFNFSLLQGIYAPRIQRLKRSLQLTQLDRLITCTVSGNWMWLPFQYYRTYTRERFNNTRTCSCWGQEEGGGEVSKTSVTSNTVFLCFRILFLNICFLCVHTYKHNLINLNTFMFKATLN